MRNALRALVIVAAGLAGLAFMTPQASAASAGVSPMTMKGVLAGSAVDSFVQNAGYRRRFRRWRRRCRRRWGYGWRYRRCMRRHGYHVRRIRRCRRWRRRCRRHFGRGWDYRRCMRRHGCRRFY